MITIDQTTFEKYLPSFTSPAEDTFLRMQPYIGMVTARVENFIGDIELENMHLPFITKFICLRAAREAIPQFDLVLTANGFGVVSNQNVAPASKERVNALMEKLRQVESITFDLMVELLLQTEWANSPTAEQYITSLLYMPSMMRRYGVRYEGREVFYDEWQHLQNRLAEAEEKVSQLISPELYNRLIEVQRIADTENPHEYNIVLEQARKVAAAWISADRFPTAPRTLSHRLLDTIKLYADKLTEYNSSSTYEAHNTPRYANKKEDTTFFFG